MNGLIVECFRSDGRTGLHSLYNEGSLNETDYFAITFYCHDRLPIDDLTVLITDFPFGLEEKDFNGKYCYVLSEDSLRRYFREEGFDFKDYSRDVNHLKMSKLFVNYPIGISEILLYDNKKEIAISEFRVNVVSNKLDEREFSNLVNYIESKSIALWTQYSLLKNEASSADAIDKGDWELLFLQRLVNDFENKLYSFKYDKLTTYKKVAEVLPYTSEIAIGEDSILWLAENLDTLGNTSSIDFEKILIQNRLFRPNEILTNSTIESTDILENRFVHGFIEYLISFLNVYKEEYNHEYGGNSFLEILYFYSQKRKYRLFSGYLNKLKEIKSYLSDFIPVSKTVLDYIPTHRMSSKDHYQYVYERFTEWFSFNIVKISNNKIYFKGVTRMDKLFERACLYKLIDLFTIFGYASEVEESKDGLPKIIKFKKLDTGRFHTLYFETYPDNYITQTNGRALKPDFFIEFDNGKILILDAKYKSKNTVQKYDWDKLCLKYLHGIGYKTGSYYSPFGLFALIPSFNNQTEFYQSRKYDLNSQQPAFPAIGSLIVDFEDKYSDLEKYMERIVDLVYLECPAGASIRLCPKAT